MSDLARAHLRAFLNRDGRELRALQRRNPRWSPSEDFGHVVSVFELAVYARFGERPDPEALRAFLTEALEDAARSRPPVRPLAVQSAVEEAYSLPDDEEHRDPPDLRAREERRTAIWFALERLVPADPAAIERLLANAAEFGDACTEYGAELAGTFGTPAAYAIRSGLARWRDS
ncbi:hypothetical protein [Glycomyces paridis]|uniref:Uncharacterized protein n=1 Tax=Glycomyces paridis TaxID=2126555 RepID=A0A4S8P5M9_9ACTN|nr:hypothetical protein [Glycomyces paridis]THV24262.1 hypothetical protein E9998_21805 [Glycomyces paridis]